MAYVGSRPQTRLALAPVLEHIEYWNERLENHQPHGGNTGLHSELARRINFPVRSVQRWAAEGVPYWTADLVACRLGLHPQTIWPDWYDLEPWAPRREKVAS